MRANESFTCNNCSRTSQTKGSHAKILFCKYCGTVLNNELNTPLDVSPMPADWSILQIGSKGNYEKKSFEFVGRMRVQLKSRYENYWCIWYPFENKYGWLIESFGFYALCSESFFPYKAESDEKFFRRDKKLELSNNLKITIDDKDKCVLFSAEGELVSWSCDAPFTVVTGTQESYIGVFLHFRSIPNDSHFLVGKWVTWEDLHLEQLRKPI